MKRLVAIFIILVLTCFLFAGCDIVDSAIDGVNASKHDINNAIIGLFSHTHNYAENIATPTCENQGYTTFTCECGDSYVGDYVDALGHDYVDNACTICGVRIYSVGLKYTSNGNGTCYVSGIGTCTDTYIVIPSVSPNGEKVIRIGTAAFYDCSSFTSVTIPNSVTSIGEGAFEGCTSLTSVTVPDSVTSIGSCAFRDCTNLTSIIIPDSVTSIDRYVFESCSKLTSVIIPDSVTSIGSGTFFDCASLSSIIIPDSVTSIGDGSFLNCTNLVSVTMGNGVTSISSLAFSGCTSLISIDVDPDNAYYKSIDGNLYTKDGKTIVQYATGKVDTTFTIPNSVTSIDEFAFLYCSSLVSVTMGNGVTSIGYGAFGHCTSLTTINYRGTAAQWNAINKDYWDYNTGDYTIVYNYTGE